jgi:hypothetical protein
MESEKERERDREGGTKEGGRDREGGERQTTSADRGYEQVHRPALLELLCDILGKLGLAHLASDFRRRVAPPGSAAAKGGGGGVGIVKGFK